MSDEVTPARSAFARDRAGIRHAGSSELTYADGSEADLLKLLRLCTNVDSNSVEALERATSWAERYHTHPGRAGVVRAFEIPSDAVVLEVGAGCGGVTRYLGEICGSVDALEPMEARALVARERTRDLASVEVFVGEIADLPPVAAYDVVVVVGVLEYVGHGTADPHPYVQFLREIRDRLRTGGTLILAIENKFGVKYLAGAPEDHTNQVFDSIEGYPRGERARTFSRSELLDMFTEAGLDGRVFGAFPDYKLTQAVFDLDAIPTGARSLLTGVPHFPSPDWTGARPRLASERLVWGELVGAGLARETPNSFVVVGGTDGAPAIWGAGRLGVDLDPQIRPELAHITEFRIDETLEATSTPRAAIDESLEWTTSSTRHDFAEGHDVATVMATVLPEERTRLLLKLGEMVRADATLGAALLTSAVLTIDGSIRLTPGALRSTSVSEEEAVNRFILWLGVGAATISPPKQWPGATTVRDVVEHFGTLAALATDWLDRTVEREAALQASVSLRYLGPDATHHWKLELDRQLGLLLAQGELGTRDFEQVESLRDEARTLRESYQASQDLLAEAQREVERLRMILGTRAS